jgi:LmbE family N-acetylglucosaminyl deacetylase
MVEKILALCAHPDDQILGLGGTIAKYAKEGKEVYAFIFSYGELSPFWLKSKITRQTRKKESEKAGKIVGIKKTIYFGLKEGILEKEVKEKKIRKKIVDFIRRHHIKKIFTHSVDDPHPDHNFISHFTLDITKNKDIGVYTFNVWNPFNFRHTDKPKIYIDVSKTYKQKRLALKQFKSQKVVMWLLLPFFYFNASLDGLKNGKRYCESFMKIK